MSGGRIILVCGGRDYDNRMELYGALDALNFQQPILGLIHGGAKGADSLAGDWMRDKINDGHKDCWMAVYPAQWDLHGKAAGPVRNQQMLDQNPGIELVVAFPGGTGTADMVKRATAKGVKVIEVP